jgi:hypothetical protein
MASPAQPPGRPSEAEISQFLADVDAWRAHAADEDFDLWASLAAVNRSIAQLTLSVSARRLPDG